jgi:glyoxylase-like metal-dependent hydrolase (beta-lactamase superfamily II)
MRRLFVGGVVLTTAVLLLVLTRRNGGTDGNGGKSQPADPFEFLPGAVNAVVIERDSDRLAIYGESAKSQRSAKMVLLTHHRRDVLAGARAAVEAGAKAVAPAAERRLIESPTEYWKDFTKKRFHDYEQQSTKVLGQSLPVDRWVKEGDVVTWKGLDFRVLDTPGYTRGAVSYLVDVGGTRVAFTGDLIYGDGQLIDLFSFQDAIPEAKIRGYHGHAARLAQLVPSLEKILRHEPDVIVPARGPIIRNPQQALKQLIDRVQDVYRNYLSTNALNWYFKEERMRICGERVLGKGADVQLMPYAAHEKPPDWIWEQNTSRLLISKSGHGFLLDCGYQKVIDSVKELMKQGRVKKVDGIFVTHCHDDHTDYVQAAADAFNCPVYALTEYEDVLSRPGAYHLPALTTNVIRDVRAVKSGAKMDWQEFELTFHFYPGQMLHHGALLARRGSDKPVFFVGDSFSPSGMDDYCLLNRNLLHEDVGYLMCLKKLREFRGNYWLINEHIPYVFSFNDKELDYLETRYRARIAALRELFPWDDPNYGIDEQWAVFYPYGNEAEAGKEVTLEVRIMNHSPAPRTFTFTPHVDAGMKLLKHERSITLAARQSGSIPIHVQTPSEAGNYLVTCDLDSKDMAFREWIEAIVTVR